MSTLLKTKPTALKANVVPMLHAVQHFCRKHGQPPRACSCTKSTRTYQCKERAPNRAPHTCKVNFIVLRPVEAAAGHHAAVFPKKTGPWVAPRIQRPAGSRTRQIRGAGQIRAICSMRPSQCRFTDRHYQSLRKLISGLCSSSQSAGADLRSQEGLWAAQLRRACNSAPWSGCQQDQD